MGERPGSIYWASIYWSVMTLTSVGYGDIAATKFNVPEQVVATLLMLTSSLIYAQVIGTYCGVVATLNPELAAFRSEMDDLNRFMSREGLPNEMRRRLREYFHQAKHLRLADAQKGLLGHMPPSLKGEVVWTTNQSWLSKIWFLKQAPRTFLTELSMSLNAMVFAPGDTPKVGFLYIVHRGIAIYRAKLITKGRVFGEDMILSSPQLRSNAQAKAMNYLEVYFTSRAELIYIARRYPRTAQAIRRAAVLLALRREVISLAKERLGLATSDKIGAAVTLMISSSNLGESAQIHHAGQLAQMKEKDYIKLKNAALKGNGEFMGVKDPGAVQEAEVPEELPEDAVIPDDPPLLCSGSAPSSPSPMKRQVTGGKRGGMVRPPPRASPFGSMQRPTSPGFGSRPGTPFGGSSHDLTALVEKIMESHRAELDTLKSELRKEQQAREEAQQAAASAQQALVQRSVDLAVQTAQRMDEVLLKLNSKHKHHRHRQTGIGSDGASLAALELGEPNPYVWAPRSVNTVHSVTSVTMEDRFQDGDREAGRTRPHRGTRRSAARAESRNAPQASMYPDPQAIANQAWLASQAAVHSSTGALAQITPGGSDPRLVA